MKGPIARGTVLASLVLGLRLFVQAVTLLLLARLLGPASYGAFAGVAALAMMMGTLSTFGTHQVLLAEISREPERPASILPVAVIVTLLCGSVLFGLYLITCLTILNDSHITMEVLLPLGLTELLLQPLLSLPSCTHLGQGRIAQSQLLTTLPLALRCIVVIILWWLQPADVLQGYVVGCMLASIAALIIATLTLNNAWPAFKSWRMPKWHEFHEAAGYAAPNLTGLAPGELDKTLATRLLPLTSAGIYSVATRVIGALTLPVIALLTSAMPRLFRDGRSDALATQRLIRAIFTVSMCYSTLLACFLWWLAPFFGWLFGQHYAELGTTIQWLCFALPGMAFRIAAGSILVTLGRPWMRAAFEVIGLTALIITSVIFTPRIGIAGMTLALALSEWLMAIIGTYWIYRSLSLGSSIMPLKND
jgi:O-antigen/teichoic acid export membrane protein